MEKGAVVEKEHHGREYMGSGVGCVLEMAAVIWGAYAFAVGAALFFSLAAISYTKSATSSWGKWARWTARTGMALVITMVMCAVPFVRDRFSNTRQAHSLPAQAAVTSQMKTPSGKSAARRLALHKKEKSRRPHPSTPAPSQPTFSVTDPTDSIVNQGSPNYGTQTINTIPRATIKASRQTESQRTDGLWTTRFVLTSSDIVPTGILRLTCDGPVISGGIESNGSLGIGRFNGPDPSDPDTLVLEISEPESISPDRPLGITVSSKAPVSIVSGSIGDKKIEF